MGEIFERENNCIHVTPSYEFVLTSIMYSGYKYEGSDFIVLSAKDVIFSTEIILKLSLIKNDNFIYLLDVPDLF